jgi:hypothetical protein
MVRGMVLAWALAACGRIGFDPVPGPGGGDGAVSSDGSGGGSGSWTVTSVSGAPAGRYWHTGVWTGGELIVFGGTTANGSNHVNTGGRYAPSTDTWSATSTANAPSTRSWHSAIWTGTTGPAGAQNLMIVWGGRGPNNTGGRYAPATDSWTATTTSGAPSARWSHTAVWTGSRMILWGGYATTAVYFNTGGQYDPAADTWTATSVANAPSARTNHAAVWTGSKMIVWGGCTGTDSNCTSGTYPTDGGIYDPIADTWTAMSAVNAPTGRQSFRAFWLGGSLQKLLVWGGQPGGGADTNTGGLYDLATNTWTATSVVGAPVARSAFSAAWTGARLIVWGGYGTGAAGSGGIYDPVTDTWAPMSLSGAPPGAGEPLGPSTVWTGSQMIVWGGDGPNSGDDTGGIFTP